MKRLALSRLALVGVVGAALVLGGCGAPPRAPGVLRLAQESDPTTLDPARAYDTTSMSFARVLYRGLVDYDADARIVPELAVMWTVSEDGRTYLFRLRPDATFHDGTPISAEDFRFAIERVLDPRTASDGTSFYENIVGAREWIEDRGGPRRLEHIAGIEVRDRVTLVFHLVEPEATFLDNLCLPFAYAVPRDYVLGLDERGESLSANPNGTGPFRFVEWVHDGWLHLERNPDYHRVEVPRVERIEARFGISSSLQTMLFEQGAIDILPISDAFPADFLRLRASPRFRDLIENAPMMDIRYVSMNNEIAPFSDRRVRQAFNHAIDRRRITGFLTGRATLANGPLPPGLPGRNEALRGYDYDPEKARRLLAEAGYVDDPNAPLPLIFPNTEAWYGKAAQSMQADLKAVGVSVSVSAMRFGDLRALAGRRGPSGARLALQGWLQDYPDPSNFLDPLFSTRSIRPESSLNRSFYSNPRVDQLLDQGRRSTDQEARLRFYEEAEALIVEDAPVIFLHHTQRYVMRQPWVTNFYLHPAWSAVHEEVGLS